jgi:hypothetical protein
MEQKKTIREQLHEREITRKAKQLDPISLDEIERVNRQLRVAYAVLSKYENKLAMDLELDPEQERLLNAQQEIIRKLETTLSALKSKADLTKKSDLDIAKELLAGGMALDLVRELYSHSPEVLEKLR